MISWVSINGKEREGGGSETAHSSGDGAALEGNHTRFEYQIRCEYETAIQRLSSLLSTEVNSVSWKATRESFEKILLDLDSFTNLEQKTQLSYLTLKNLSLMKDQEGDFHGAFQDAIKALSYSNFKNETALLVRIAYLSLQSNEIWTCQALLSSGHLSQALRPIYDDLCRKCRKALLLDPHCPVHESHSPLKPIPILAIRFELVSSLPPASSRLLHFLKALASLKTTEVIEYCQSGFLFLLWKEKSPESSVVSEVQIPEANAGDQDPSVACPARDNDTRLRKSSRLVPRKQKEADFDYSSHVTSPAMVGTEAKSENCWESISSELQAYASVTFLCTPRCSFAFYPGCPTPQTI
jgi:hypothetical protein